MGHVKRPSSPSAQGWHPLSKVKCGKFSRVLRSARSKPPCILSAGASAIEEGKQNFTRLQATLSFFLSQKWDLDLGYGRVFGAKDLQFQNGFIFARYSFNFLQWTLDHAGCGHSSQPIQETDEQ
jgi:hypothetical protein